MSAYKAFIGLVVFFGLFTGAMNFQTNFYEEQDVSTNGTQIMDNEYEKLRNNIDKMRENVRQVQSPEESLLDSAVAGLYLVPNFLTLILAPITITTSFIDSLAAQYIFFPKAAAVMLKSLVIIGISWSAFRLLIGLRG